MTPKAWSDDFLNQPIVQNSVQVDHISVQKGDVVFVRPQHLSADATFTSYEEIAQRNQLSVYERSENKLLNELSKRTSPRQSTVNMTAEDFKRELSEYARKMNITSSQEARTKFLEMTGKRPLFEGQVKLSIQGISGGMYESIYSIEDLAFTKNVDSKFFKIQERVLFPSLVNGNIVYKQGLVTGIYINGDLIVQKGLETARVSPEHLFSSERSYAGQKYKLGEELLYKFKRGGTQTVSEESVKVIGASPSGDIVIFLEKLGQFIKISAHEMTSEMAAKGLSPVTRAPVSCNKLFI